VVEALEARWLLAADLMTIEDQRALNLVPDALFFNSANPFDPKVPKTAVPGGEFSVQSGNWDDPATWNTGKVPADGSNALIAAGTTVTITGDEALTPGGARNAIDMLRVDGTLAFDTSALAQNPNPLRRLLVDTIVVSPMNVQVPDGKGGMTWQFTGDEAVNVAGAFQMGNDTTDAMGNVTSVVRVPAGVRAVVAFADNGPVGDKNFTQEDHITPSPNQSSDPYQMGRGLIAMGQVRVYGQTVTSDATVVPTSAGGPTLVGPSANAGKPVTTIFLTAVPADWSVGDRMVITGDTADNANNQNQDEQFAIASIDRVKNSITINDPANPKSKGLVYDHTAPAGASIYVADVSRNAVFVSENPVQVADRGHVIFMHDMDVHLDAGGFYGLGRTDKRNPIDDPVIVQDYRYDPVSNGPVAIPGQFTDDVLDIKNPDLAKYDYRVMVPVVDANGKPVLNPDGTPELQIARTGLNPRARYSVHFHHAMPMMDGMTGMMPGGMEDTVNDISVVDAVGWGIVNHSSAVAITNNVVYNAVGSAFVTEAGDEVGSFIGNIAIHSMGSGAGIESRQQFQDFGHEGVGYWFQGGNIDVENNVAAGMRSSGFVFFPVGLAPTLQSLPGTKPVTGSTAIPVAALPPDIQALYKPGAMVPVGDVPLMTFKGNTAFGVGDGFESWFSLLNVGDSNPKDTRRTVVSNFTVFGTQGTGLFDPYTNRITFDHVTALGNLSHPSGTGFSRNDVTRNAVYDHVNVAGFTVGINAPVNGVNSVIAGSFENVENIYITTAATRARVVNIDDASPTDPIRFIPLPAKAADPSKQFDIYLQTNYNPKDQDLTDFFNPDVIRLGTVKVHGQQVYYLEQAADFVPFPTGSPAYVPAALVGLTNQQMWNTYGLSIAGLVAPVDSKTGHVDRVHGLVGPAGAYPVDLYLLSKKYSQFPQNKSDANNDWSKVAPYTLSYKYADPANPGKFITVTEKGSPTALVQGWNLVTRTVNGMTRTLLVYGDDIPPDFVPAKDQVWTINTADFNNNAIWVLQGEITDDSFGQRFFRKNFTLGDTHFFSALFQKTGADGKLHTYTTFSMTITDFAGNKTVWTHDLEVTDTAPLQKDLGRKYLPDIIPSETLIALIDSDPSIPKKK
jgi:hypothetical protein